MDHLKAQLYCKNQLRKLVLSYQLNFYALRKLAQQLLDQPWLRLLRLQHKDLQVLQLFFVLMD
jgi:hypothetical protein